MGGGEKGGGEKGGHIWREDDGHLAVGVLTSSCTPLPKGVITFLPYWLEYFHSCSKAVLGRKKNCYLGENRLPFSLIIG